MPALGSEAVWREDCLLLWADVGRPKPQAWRAYMLSGRGSLKHTVLEIRASV